MLGLHRQCWSLLCFIFCTFMFAGQAYVHNAFIFNGFNSSDLNLLGNASIQSKALRLTNTSQTILGRAFYPSHLRIKHNNTLVSFSSSFIFSMVPPPSKPGGHGLAFIMSPFHSVMEALPAQFMGLVNDTSNGQPSNHLFAVEFDTSSNVEFQDIDNNHVGIDLNSLKSVDSQTAGYWIGDKFHKLSLNSGQNIQAWVDYDHVENQVNVELIDFSGNILISGDFPSWDLDA